MATREKTGEPYELAGKRLVFTNWRYIRPGYLRWNDEEGRNVSARGPQGPWDAHFQFGERPTGIQLRVQPAQRAELDLEPEHPWEKTVLSISTWLQDDGVIRAWGSCSPSDIAPDPEARPTGERYLCYLESDDGVTWRRPNLGLYEYGGSKNNNLLGPNTEFGSVFIDPDGPESERYKWIHESHITREEYDRYRARRPEAWDPAADRVDVPINASPVGDPGAIMSLRGAVSPDGLRWKKLPDPLVVQHTDTEVVGYYDTHLRKYVAYLRDWDVGPHSKSPELPDDRGLSWIASGRRSIGRSETDDFRNFPLSEMILTPGPEMLPTDVLYTNCRTSVPGAPDQHLMFPAVWHTATDTTSIVMGSSPDGKIWHYLPGGPVLTTSPFGQWDGGCVFTSPNLVEFGDGSWALRYRGYNVPHKYPIGGLVNKPGLALWPHGRLVALEAPELGQFSTVSLIPPGRKLRINARTQRAGHILVEAARLDRATVEAGSFGDANPRVLADAWTSEGHTFADANPIIGDHPSALVTWRGTDDLGHGDGMPIILRFRMDHAQIFSLDFE